MFFGNILLDRKGPYSILWRAAHGVTKSIPRKQIREFNAVKLCESLVDTIPGPLSQVDSKTKFSLYLISQLLYGVVVVVKKQGEILLVDVEDLRSTFSIAFRTKRKRLRSGQLSLNERSKRRKVSEDIMTDECHNMINIDIMVEELDQAFLNNRVEIARLEDITLKEVDLGFTIREEISDALTDFGEKSTLREQLGLGLDFIPTLEKGADILEDMPQKQQGAEQFVTENISASHSEELTNMAGIRSPDNRNIIHPDSVTKVIEEVEALKAAEAIKEPPTKKKSNKRARKRTITARVRGQLWDNETTIPLEEITKRVKDNSLYLRPRSSLFELYKEKNYKTLLRKDFALPFANSFFNDEWVPRSRTRKPMTFEEALHYSGRGMVTDPVNQIIGTEANVESISTIEHARASSSTFLKSSTTKSATVLFENMKVSSLNSTVRWDTGKVSEPLASVWLEKYVEEWSGLPKSSHLIHDISLANVSLSQVQPRREDVSKKLSCSLVSAAAQEQTLIPIDIAEQPQDLPVAEPSLNKKAAEQSRMIVEPVTDKEQEGIFTNVSFSLSNEMLMNIRSLSSNGASRDIHFSEILDSHSKASAAKSFSSLLNLLKENKIRVTQEVPFGEITISLVS